MNAPLVSISCITYNHAPYIRQCLEGFLMQQCDFEYEILIHDDASTDGTSDIIREYQEKYPEIIKPIMQTENQYSKGIRGMMARFNFPRAKGKYIALCEGDDYWTDPLKLQKQVDFLEANPDFVLCFHDCRYIKKDLLAERFLEKYNFQENREVSAKEYQNWIAQTATIVQRNIPDIFKEFAVFKHVFHGDLILRRIVVKYGKIYMFNEVMSVYRIHEGGMTSTTKGNEADFKKIKQIKEMSSYFGDKLPKKLISKWYLNISKRAFIAKKIQSFIRYFMIAFYYSPSFVIKQIKNDVIRKLG